MTSKLMNQTIIAVLHRTTLTFIVHNIIRLLQITIRLATLLVNVFVHHILLIVFVNRIMRYSSFFGERKVGVI